MSSGLFDDPEAREAPASSDAAPARRGARGPVGPADTDAELRELAAALPAALHLGTSSWSFPGWSGLVYDKPASESVLSRKGLAAYSRHPLLRVAGIDRGFYSPLSALEYAAYADQVPDHFRFTVKAPAAVTDAVVRGEDGRGMAPNPGFLDARLAIEQFVQPATEGLDMKAGPLVFQFPPLPRALLAPGAFAARLDDFLAALPPGPLYAVEVRDSAVLDETLMRVLADNRARYCFGVHPRLPALPEQARLSMHLPAGPMVARWNLHAGLRYEQAKSNYAPFNRLVDPDPRSRKHLAQLAMRALLAGHPVYITVNNKAEGSAPLSCIELGRAVAELDARRRSAVQGDHQGVSN